MKTENVKIHLGRCRYVGINVVCFQYHCVHRTKEF